MFGYHELRRCNALGGQTSIFQRAAEVAEPEMRLANVWHRAHRNGMLPNQA